MPDNTFEVIIVGAGWQGIAAAKVYLDVCPHINLCILDPNSTIGGTWALQNLHPQLMTQNVVGTLEYSWYPFKAEEYGLAAGSHLPADVVHLYLSRAAEQAGIMERILFGVKVLTASPDHLGGWKLETATLPLDSETDIPGLFFCKKLVVATGIASTPKLTDLPNIDVFRGQCFGYSDLLHANSRAKLNRAGNIPVVVLGGSKSAYDAVLWMATQGQRVNWVIQRSGHGPCWIAAATIRLLFWKVLFERLATTRIFSVLSPCVWGDADGLGWLRRLIHRTWIGRKLVEGFWSYFSREVLASAISEGHLDFKGWETLKPDSGFQWQATSTGIMNYPDTRLADLVKNGLVKIHRQDVVEVVPEGVQLTNGVKLESSTIIHAAGWSWACPITFSGIDTLTYGIPTAVSDHSNFSQLREQSKWADGVLAERFPWLLRAPARPLPRGRSELGDFSMGVEYTPWRLYRGIAPPTQVAPGCDRNLVFLGMFNTYPKSMLSEVQALWAVGYLEGFAMTPNSADAVTMEITLWSRWGRMRYPFGHSAKYPDTAFDILPYFDLLFSDLGLKKYRKRSLWRDLFEPYGPDDIRECLGEFCERFWAWNKAGVC